MSEKPRLQISNEDRIQTSCLLILTALAIAAAMKAFSAVLIPFVLAIFLTYCLAPVIELQQKRLKIPRPLAILTTALIGCLLMFLVGLLISTAIDEISANRDDYQAQIAKIFATVTSSPLFARFGFVDSDMTETLLKIPADTAKTIFTATANSIMSVLSNGLLVLIFMIFMLTGKSTIPSAPGSVRFEIEGCIKRYTFTMLATSSVTGTLVGLVLSLIGVDFAWMFGFL
ncbi:MAG: AI-2E family transporter, partial [Candidatus Scalindua sp.]